MSNTLTFQAVHKSITSLDGVTLPKFVVLTGKNGSGKTHLLTAIRDGKVHSSLVSDLSTDVRLFNSADIIPADTGIFHPASEQATRSQWFNVIKTKREEAFPNLQQFVIQQGIPASYCRSIKNIDELSILKLLEILPDSSNVEVVYNNIRNQINAISTQIYSNSVNQIGDDNWRKAAPKLQQASPEFFLTSSESSFFKNKHFLWGLVDPFQQAFGRVFTTYRELVHQNERYEKHLPAEYLTQNEFLEQFGTPPWDFVNQILEECHLDFRMDNPPLHETTSYEPKLHKQSIVVEMRFQDLSSGEKVLMSFALCLYNSQDARQEKVFPKLLLLDEVDAPLHPSMAASLLKTIQNVLVRDKNVAVILSTHSPSTVALAPEEAIYSMNPIRPNVEKINKSNALSLLTAGVPTLSISFDGRRQIFVESRTDANLYDSLYQRYKSHLNTERSLVFIEVGVQNKNGLEQNAGCDQVIKLVSNLSDAGNKSILGLVDWDGERQTKDRVHILSPSIRDGLESLLFDPVLLIATIARENITFAKKKNIFDKEDTYISIVDWSAERWQAAIDLLQDIILEPSQAKRETVDISYLNGMTLNVAKEYLHIDDHVLEEKITKNFEFLKPKNKRAGELMRHIVDTVLVDYPKFLPRDLLDTFDKLVKSEVM